MKSVIIPCIVDFRLEFIKDLLDRNIKIEVIAVDCEEGDNQKCIDIRITGTPEMIDEVLVRYELGLV